MKAHTVRFLISIAGILIFGVLSVESPSCFRIFIGVSVGLAAFVIGNILFHRLANRETLRRDLEERVRNQHL